MTTSDSATKYSPTADWTESDWTVFTSWITSMLHSNTIVVTFTKKDGTERVMRCTLQTDLLPEPPPLKEGAKERKQSTTSIRVFDLELNEWRAFTTKNVKRVQFSLEPEPSTYPFPTREKP